MKILARVGHPRPVTIYDRIGGHEALLSDAPAAAGVPTATVTEILSAVAPLAREIETGEPDKSPGKASV
jgi:hypothetical protein